jgi:hypothetical protein
MVKWDLPVNQASQGRQDFPECVALLGSRGWRELRVRKVHEEPPGHKVNRAKLALLALRGYRGKPAPVGRSDLKDQRGPLRPR